MQNQKIRCSYVLGFIAFTAAACGSDPGSTVPSGDDEAARAEAAFAAGNIEKASVTHLASIQGTDRAVDFFVVDENGDVAFRERFPITAQSLFAKQPNIDALDAYLALTGSDAPVPRALARVSPQKAAGRTLVDAIAKPLAIDLAARGLDVEVQPLAAVGYCTPSVDGANYFEAHSCKLIETREQSCDPMYNYITGQNWTDLYRASVLKHYKSYSRTAACKTSGAVRHYYWNGLKWKETMYSEIPVNDQEWWTYTGGAPWYRRVRHFSNSPSLGGFIRAWTDFY